MNEEFEIYNTEIIENNFENNKEIFPLSDEQISFSSASFDVSNDLNYPQLTFFGVILILLFLILTKLGGSK